MKRYGYSLDIQKLGHQNLSYLLQVMLEVKLESTYIFPCVPVVSASDGETSILKTQITNVSHVALSSDESPETFESDVVQSIASAVKIDESSAKSDDLSACQTNVVSLLEDSISSELDQTIGHFEDSNKSELDQNVICSGKPELFSCGYFWNDMESFIFTIKGSFLVSCQKTASRSKLKKSSEHDVEEDNKSIASTRVYNYHGDKIYGERALLHPFTGDQIRIARYADYRGW
ncbi:hypothetical protein VNO80_19061 [Phaseolus coccineus]|uniref:Uncharacterized protein n=1 Tax=Phaseolus coccineus TaxID=3886 RepID=A0AAN9MEW9_PHACN